MAFFCAGFSSEANKSQKKSQKGGGTFLEGVGRWVRVGVDVGRYVCMYVCAVWAYMVCVGVSEKA